VLIEFVADLEFRTIPKISLFEVNGFFIVKKLKLLLSNMKHAKELALQGRLTLKWIENPSIFKDVEYYLIARELMFPSRRKNDKYTKWNEVSIDFILYRLDLCIRPIPFIYILLNINHNGIYHCNS